MPVVFYSKMRPLEKKGQNSYLRIRTCIGSLCCIKPTPRLLFFFITIVVKLAASAISAIGFVWGNSTIMLIGVFVWLLWFALLAIIALPNSDERLKNQIRWLKPTAITIASDGSVAVVKGDENAASLTFSDTFAAAGGPPLVPVTSCPIG